MMMMEKREKSSSTTTTTGVVLGAGSGRGDEAGGGYTSSGTTGGGSTGGFNASVRTAESLLRIVPMALCVAALVVMLKNSQSNDFGAVSYADLGGFRYLVYANGICACYSLLSALYMASVPRSSSSSYYSTSLSHAWTVFFFDQVLTYVILAAGTVSAEVIYLAYKGDAAITWSEACGVFGGFCRKATVSVGITFASLLCYVLLSLISSYRLFSNYDAPNVNNANYPTKAIEATNTGAAAAAAAFNAHG